MLARELQGLAGKLDDATHAIIGSTVEGSGADDTLEALAAVWSVRQCLGDWANRIAKGELGQVAS